MGTIFIEENGHSPIVRTDSSQKTVKFPLTVRHRSHTAKIYGKSARDKTYRTSWYAGGKRVQRSFRKLSDARAAALAALKQIAQGQTDAAALSPKEVRDLRLAQNALRELDVQLLDAITEYTTAKRFMPTQSLETAARAWQENVSDIQSVPIKQVALEYLADKKGMLGTRTHREEEHRLKRVYNVLQMDMCDLSKKALELFFSDELGRLGGKTRNHFRQSMRQLFMFAVRRDYLPKQHRLDEVLVKEPSGEAAPEIIKPSEFEDLLSTATTELRPYIALAGFTGARRSEILRMTWRDVWRVQDHVELEAEKTKTQKRRHVPIQPVLFEWLKPYRRKQGAIWKRTNGAFNYALVTLMKKCNLKGHNLLRHSYASYRLAQIHDAPKVAYELGNSPEKLFSNYNKLVSPQEADAWFSIMPSDAAEKTIAAA